MALAPVQGAGKEHTREAARDPFPAIALPLRCPDGQFGREPDGTTHTQAEEFIEKVRRDTQEGRLSLPQGRKIAVGFREAATRYLDKLTEEGGKDLVAKRRRLTLHLVPFHAAMDALEARYTFQPLATAQRG